MDQHIELIARAVVIDGDSVLLCKPKEADYYYFSGGHVEFDEDSVTALKRELKEETDADVASIQFIGVWENSFLQKHEVNPVFEATLASASIKNMEDHIETAWVSLEEFKNARVLPVGLQEKVLQWMENREVFFGREKNDAKLV